MAARRADLAGLPGWPRRLSESQAAAYLGVSVGTFRLEVRAGVMPPALPASTGRTLWDREELDDAVDRQRRGSEPETADDWLGRFNAGAGQRRQAGPR